MSLDPSIEHPARVREEELRYPWSYFDVPARDLPFPPLQTTIEEWVRLIDNSTTGGPVSVALDRSVCETDGAPRNCSEACSDPAYLFRPLNFRSCLLLTGMAALVQQGSYTVDTEDEGTVEALGLFGDLDLISFNASGALSSIAQCVSDACDESGEQVCGGLAKTLMDMSNPANTTSSEISSSLIPEVTRYCSGTEFRMDGDIAGPGVMLSYAFQTGLAFVFYLFVKLSRTWTRRFMRLGSCNAPDIRERGKRLQRQFSESSFGAAAITSVAEFHEVQCYFVVSIQLATQLNFNSAEPRAAGNTSTSFGEAIFNSEASIVLSIASIAPVLLTQFLLQRSGMHWWYTFIAMSATVLMAVITYARQAVLMVSTDGLWQNLVQEQAVSSCGMNPAPIVYCGLFNDLGFTTMGTIPIYICCLVGLVAWVGLLVDQIAFTIHHKFPLVERKVRLFGWVARFSQTYKQNRVKRWLVGAFFTFADAILVFNLTMYVVLLAIAIGETDVNDLRSWGFGQLVAVMVWTPTVAKYFYYLAFGIEGGFQERIPEYYTISRQPTQEGELHPRAEHKDTADGIVVDL